MDAPVVIRLVRDALRAPLRGPGGALGLWTRAGLARCAEFEDVNRVEIDAVLGQMVRAGEVLESDAGGLLLVDVGGQ